MMSCVVAYKWTSNPQDASVEADGTVDWSRATAALSDYDTVALEVGRQFADAVGTDLVGVSVGTSAVKASLAKKAVASRGPDRLRVVARDEASGWNATETARVLAGLVSGVEDVDIVLTGEASVDEGAALMPALIAGVLGWPCFEDIESVEKTETGLRLRQSAPEGTRTIEVAGPAVVALTTDAALPRVPGMRDILSAGKKPLEEVDLAPEEGGASRATVIGTSRPQAATRQSEIFDGDDSVDRLVAALHERGAL